MIKQAKPWRNHAGSKSRYCCFNRLFDDQSQIRIKLEAEAKLYIQEKIRRKEVELVWSYILDYENQVNPFEERKRAIQQWKDLAAVDISETPDIVKKAEHLQVRIQGVEDTPEDADESQGGDENHESE